MGPTFSYIVILNLPMFAHDLLMQFELKTRHQNDCNVGLMIWKKWLWSTISNRKICTIWMKVDFQLEKRKLEDVLLMLKFVKNFKQSQDVKSGFRWWNVFVLMEVLFLRLLFFEQRTFHDNGFPRAFVAIGDLVAILKIGLAIFMECSGFVNALNLRRVIKQRENIDLLICDGHDSHITGEWIAHCMDNNIILMILPPHSSHLTQPLDVGIFDSLKKHMAAEIDPLIRLGVARIQKME